MKTTLLFLLLLSGFASAGNSSKKLDDNPIVLYVSPKGKDTNKGSKSAPLKSLQGARDRVRILRKANPQKPVQVIVDGGVYYQEEAIVFTEEDSGNENAPVTYEAKKGTIPVFTGSKSLTNWQVLTDPSQLSRLAPGLSGKIYVTNLRDVGITNFGDATDMGLRPELFSNNELQTLARWPNTGFTKAGKVRGKTPLPPTYLAKTGTKEGLFDYVQERQNKWALENDPRLGGYWYWDWAEEFQKVGKIDTTTKTIHLKEPYHGYGYKDSLRFFGLNLFCELDIPNEWYLDGSSGLLYWYPPTGIDPKKADVKLTVFSSPYMVEIKNCHNFFLKGLTFQESRGSAVSIENGQKCVLKDCRMERFGRDGVHVKGGKENGISGCFLGTLGYSGITLTGGDRKTLTPSGHFVENTVVEHFSLFKRTYQPAIHITGCGYRISNNRFRYSSSSAFRLEGNDIVLEYNQISHVVNESDDQGGLDIFYNPSYRGIVVRYNHWSDISGGTFHGSAGVRLDDLISGVHVHGNIFERCGAKDFGAVQIHGGKDNVVENNLFVKCIAAVSFSTWGQKRYLETLELPIIQKKLYEEVDIRTPLYLEKYPALKTIREGADINTAINNLVVDCPKLFLRDKGIQITENNTVITGEGKTLDVLTTPEFLKNYGLTAIPYQEIGPKNNPWAK
jgi:hypothetical protein